MHGDSGVVREREILGSEDLADLAESVNSRLNEKCGLKNNVESWMKTPLASNYFLCNAFGWLVIRVTLFSFNELLNISYFCLNDGDIFYLLNIW